MKRLRRLGSLVLLGLAFAVVVGSLLGQPVLLGSVESGSMEPGLSTGDGFVAVPRALAGDVGPGSVVVYRAEELNGGGLVTHRIVDETQSGFVTKGDANSFVDQASGEPPVQEAQVVAVAPQFAGNLLVLPGLGTAVGTAGDLLTRGQRLVASVPGVPMLSGTRGLALLIFVVSGLGYAVTAWRERASRTRRRAPSRETGVRTRLVVATLAAFLILAATSSMVLPAGTTTYEVVSAEFDAPGARVVPAGESEVTTHPIGNGGVIPMEVFLEPGSDGVDVQPRTLTIPGRDGRNATVTLGAPPETGFYRRYVVEHRYLAILPESVLHELHALHPWAPIVAIDALLGVSFYLIGLLLGGRTRLRDRSRSGARTLLSRLRRVG